MYIVVFFRVLADYQKRGMADGILS